MMARPSGCTEQAAGNPWGCGPATGCVPAAHSAEIGARKRQKAPGRTSCRGPGLFGILQRVHRGESRGGVVKGDAELGKGVVQAAQADVQVGHQGVHVTAGSAELLRGVLHDLVDLAAEAGGPAAGAALGGLRPAVGGQLQFGRSRRGRRGRRFRLCFLGRFGKRFRLRGSRCFFFRLQRFQVGAKPCVFIP